MRKTRHPAQKNKRQAGLYRRLVHASQDLVYRIVFDPEPRYSFISPTIQQVIGYSADEFYSDALLPLRIVHPEDRSYLEQLFTGQLTDPVHVLRFIHKSGWIVYTQHHNNYQFSPDGRLLAIEGMARDFTQTALLQNNFTRLVQNSPIAIQISVLETGEILEVNEGALQMTGFTQAEMIGKSTTDLALWPDPGDRGRMVDEILRTGTLKNIEVTYRKKSGELAPAIISADLIEYQGRKCLISMLLDISAVKSSAQALRESEERLRYIIQHAPGGIALLDRELRYLFVSDRYAQDFHLAGQPVIGRSLEELSLKIPDRWRDACQQALTGSTSGPEEELIQRAGSSPAYARWECMPWYLASGEIGGALLFSEMITERKQRELEMEAIATISNRLRFTSSASDAYSLLIEQVRTLLHPEAGAILTHGTPTAIQTRETSQPAWLVRHSWGAWAGLEGMALADTQDFPPAAAADPSTDQADSGLPHTASAPLSTEGSLFGTVWIGCRRPLQPAELRLLDAISSITASALHRASLYHQTELQLQRLTSLRSIDQAISASLDLRVTLNILVNQITLQLKIDAANVLLYRPHTQVLVYAAGRNLDHPDFKDMQIRLGQSAAGQVALTRKLMYVNDIHTLDPVLERKLVRAGFVTYIALPLIAKGRVKGVLELFHRSPLNADPEWLEFLQTVAAQAAIAIDNAELFDQLQRLNTKLTMAYDATIEGWSRVLELRDREGGGHSQRVTELTMALARRMRVPEGDLIHMQRGALLHDIGKLALPDSVLFKPGPLDEAEFEQVRKHTHFSVELIRPIDFLRPALAIPAYHHERWDGSGYPDGLKGEEIPLPARIFAIVDVWDALTSDTVYRKAWNRKEAYHYILDGAGSQFDPQVVEAFAKEIGELGNQAIRD